MSIISRREGAREARRGSPLTRAPGGSREAAGDKRKALRQQRMVHKKRSGVKPNLFFVEHRRYENLLKDATEDCRKHYSTALYYMYRYWNSRKIVTFL